MPKRVLTEEQKQRARDNLAKAREAREAKKAEAAADEAMLSEPVAALEAEAAAVNERRERLLQGIDPAIAALISDDELDKIEREEQDRASAERKKRALEDVRASMRQRARVENDLISADVLRSAEEKARLAEPVTFRIKLPNAGSGNPSRGSNCFRVDGFEYQNGQTYTRSRAIFESLQSNFYQTWVAEMMFRTLDQQKVGNDVRSTIGSIIPQFEVMQ